jgi:ABC-type molybdenum transport system ATPase subunit/photorepair protein PhrA
MLKRLYIDNYRSLVNFEFKPGSLCLLLGDNGSGKSTLLDVIELLRDFISGQGTVNSFPTPTLTRWQLNRHQRFEADFLIDGKIYAYSLVIEHEWQRGLRRVQQEHLHLDGQPLYAFQEGVAQLYREDHSLGPSVSFDWSRSGIGFLQAGPANLHLNQFREYVARIIVCSLDPGSMESESDQEIGILDRRGRQFVSWYRAMALESPAATMKMAAAIREVMAGFSALPFRESGSKRLLKAQFDGFETGRQSRYIEYSFDELSDGQRALLVLYALIYAHEDHPFVICLDEPDNYVALREIQPWLAELEERCATVSGSQAILVSHHPEVMNYLGEYRIVMLERDQGGPTRIKPFSAVPGLAVGETVARGWE